MPAAFPTEDVESRHYLQCLQGPFYLQGLTHLPLDKMAAILADDIFKRIFLNENGRIQIQIHWNLFLTVQLTIALDWFR